MMGPLGQGPMVGGGLLGDASITGRPYRAMYPQLSQQQMGQIGQQQDPQQQQQVLQQDPSPAGANSSGMTYGGGNGGDGRMSTFGAGGFGGLSGSSMMRSVASGVLGGMAGGPMGLLAPALMSGILGGIKDRWGQEHNLYNGLSLGPTSGYGLGDFTSQTNTGGLASSGGSPASSSGGYAGGGGFGSEVDGGGTI